MLLRNLRIAVLSVFWASAYAQDIDEIDIEELLTLEVDTAATLTRTEIHKSPAAITRISSDMIKRSGARSLEELLGIFVPNLGVEAPLCGNKCWSKGHTY